MAHAERWRAWIERRLGRLGPRLSAGSRAAREVLFGLTLHELDVSLRKERGSLNNLFMLAVFGDLVGLPLLPPYYSMRLLPYIVPSLHRWKRSLFRERDITDLASHDL
jgi:hypothetical protein